MRRGLLVAVAIVTLSGCAGRGGAPTTAAPRPTRQVLSNSVVLIAQEHRASDVVALQLWMRVGARDESADELGLSHYLEHMLFKGTPTRPPGSIDALIEGLGGQSNAFTSYDYTHYDVVLPAEQLAAGIELLADIAVNASFEQSELDAERKVVFEEMRLTEDNPDRFMRLKLQEAAYRPHPYGRPLLGKPQLIGALTRQRLRAYYTKYYVPANMVLVAVGAVRLDEVQRVAAATFGRLTLTGPRRPVAPGPPALDRARRVDVERPEQQATLGIAWRVAPTNEPEVYAVDLLTYILGDGPSSRLNQRLRERERLVFAIDAGYGAWEKAGLVSVIARLDPRQAARAEASVLAVLRQIREQGVTEAERQRAIVTAESSYAFDIETAEGLAKTYGQAETTWTLDNELAYLSRLRQVTAAEIQAVARKYFRDDNYARVLFTPKEAAR